MELTETIDTINRQLRDEFGVDTITGKPIYRVVWSEDQFEKRLTYYTKEGLALLTPRVEEFPKYRQWIKERYILERLSAIVAQDNENAQLTVNKYSYEPLWTFMDNQFNYLPPKWEVCKIVIDTVHAALYGTSDLAKYKDKGEDPEETRQRIAKVQEELFGNETDVGDALAHKEAIIVPRNFEGKVS